MEEILTMKEAQALLKISRSSIYRLMWSKQLQGHKIGNGPRHAWRFYRVDLERLVHAAQSRVET